MHFPFCSRHSKQLPACALLSITISIVLLAAGSMVAQQPEPPVQSGASVTDAPVRPLRRVRRAPRPEFDRSVWEQIFFPDLFAEGLQGQRPRTIEPGQPIPAVAATNDDAQPTAAGAWSAVIPAAMLEDEIKRQQNRLTGLVANPGQFQSQNIEAGESFQMLAIMFGIIAAYDDQVRWRDSAPAAVSLFAAAAVRARSADRAAFESSSAAASQLTALLRGESPGSTAENQLPEDWSEFADRSAIMYRLEENTSGEMRTGLAAADEFAGHTESIAHEASVVAALARVLQQNGMPDADDEDYRALAEEMANAAMALRDSTASGQFEAAAASLNRLNQACINCHADWK